MSERRVESATGGGGDLNNNAHLGHFKSKFGLILSCLGCVVGTGNIWRFPRIVANNSGGKGCLQFILVWLMFLCLWSIPIIIIEYAVGRYTRRSTVRSFRILIGPWSSWCGGWMILVNALIGCYYSVVLGWCFYFLFRSIFFHLPTSHDESLQVWDNMEKSSWPIFCHFISVLLASISIAKAVKSIELVNKIMIPVLLVIMVVTFIWSLTLKFASHGITYLFTPDWGAGVGLFLTYATFMTRDDSVVKIGTLLPATNNLISMLCCITTFSTVFSVEMTKGAPLSKDDIVKLLKNNGKANTGLTFIWMPLLYNSFGAAGRALCAIFFLCLSLAGISSLISMFELIVHTLQDMKVPRKYGLPLVAVLVFFIGLASAIDINVLVNQDFVWSFALIIAGAIMASLPIRYGIQEFRRVLVNTFGTDDWTLPKLWEIIIKYITPLEALALLIWWTYDNIHEDNNWYKLSRASLMMAVLQWVIALICLLAANLVWLYYKRLRRNGYTVQPNYGATDDSHPTQDTNEI